VTSSASSRRRGRITPPLTTRSALQLRLARRSLCPHCGRVSPTVQGVCADCWGSKGGRQFWIRKTDQRWPFEISPLLLGAVVALLPGLALVVAWILG
jgi:hypothetical protein